MVKKRKPKQDEPVANGRLVKKRFDFNSYDVNLTGVCTADRVRPIVGIGVVGCMKVQ